MKKKNLFKVTIEETISETFDIYATNAEEAEMIAINKYNNCDIILSPGELLYKQLVVSDADNNPKTEWREF